MLKESYKNFKVVIIKMPQAIINISEMGKQEVPLKKQKVSTTKNIQDTKKLQTEILEMKKLNVSN